MNNHLLMGKLAGKIAVAVGLPVPILTYHWLGCCHFMPMVFAALRSVAAALGPKTNIRPRNALAGGNTVELNHSVTVKEVTVPPSAVARAAELFTYAYGPLTPPLTT